MKNWMLIIFCCWAISGQGSVITWTNVAGGNWSNPQNWNPNQVPATSDDALIATGGTYTVVVDTNSLSVSNLIVGAGTASMGAQTLSSTNPQSLTISVSGQLLITNDGTVLLSVSGLNYIDNYSGIVSASPLLIDQGGSLTCSNMSFKGDLQIQNGGVLNLNYSTAGDYYSGTTDASVTVSNGGVVNALSGLYVQAYIPPNPNAYVAAVNGPLTIANGGVFNVVNNVKFNALVTVGSGGILNVGFGTVLSLFDILTNSGTINLTNSAITIIGFNDDFIGVPGELLESGAINNLPGGLINLQGQSSIWGEDNGQRFKYNQTNDFAGTLTNSGVIIASGTNSISTTFLDNSEGTITNYSGQLDLSTIPTTTSNTFSGEFYPEEGATISLNSVSNLIGAPNLLFSATPLVSNRLIFRGGGGTAWGTYVVLQSTNLATSLPNWTPITTNTFDSQGGFIFTNVPAAGSPGNFFVLKEH